MKNSNYGYTPAEYKKFRLNAWVYLLLFSLLYCAHYCTRLNFSNAKVVMDLSKEEIGIITSSLFWCYGIGHLVNGRLGEIVGVRRFITLSVVLSAATNILMGFQSSVLIMAILWGFNGFFQSMAWSPGVSSLTAWWPSDRRGFATGFANAFSGFGEVAAKCMVLLGFAILPALGWRSAFFVPAALPLIVLVIYLIFAKSGPKSIGLKDYEEDDVRAEKESEMTAIVKEKGVLYPYVHLLKNKLFLVWVFVVFSSGLARYGLATWIPDYLKEKGLGITSSILTSIVLPIGMGIGTLIIPTLTDKFCPNNRLLAGVVSGFAAAACIVGFMLLKPQGIQLALMLVLLFFAGFFIYAINGVVWTFAADVGGRVFASTAAGILDFAAYMGAAIQSMLFGFILGDGNWNILFISVSAFCFVIAIVSLVCSKKK